MQAFWLNCPEKEFLCLTTMSVFSIVDGFLNIPRVINAEGVNSHNELFKVTAKN
jgi:hypothetical protein